ncbi:BTAD domain-containing putative transcriptional regulator [Tumebacillus sp. DT12]|uniref:BTAD domain-containing putative transcriptional regulator n=1 Tax=Tumebacillus lacus TaxID=2995335 RepID=A0ABT3WVY3_9BACL|nr:BTAD domain-containing putative transcriptional regulator [Tumebacillus lacus]MCX7568843.1 BTAD domain-containing putative transcriptional regulator [Tumebacillus lacus]
MRNEQHLVLATKLVPPRVKAQCLRRERLHDLFAAVTDYPVTLIQAAAGYGKSTALVAHLCSRFDHVAWYSVEEGERDIFLFLRYLIHALKALQPQIGERSLRLLQEAELTSSALQPALTLLINDIVELAPDPAVLVLDDVHAVADTPEIRTLLDLLVRYLPPHLHLVLGSRTALELPAIQKLNATYDLLKIGKQELTFTFDEIDTLFEQEYGITLAPEQVRELEEQTEGWVIALQMIWKGLEQGVELRDLWRTHPEPGRRLFHYLAEEVFDRQPEPVQNFLRRTCILELLDPPLCDRLTGREDAAKMLTDLERDGLFVTGGGAGDYRYHRLFQQFLVDRSQATLTVAEWLALHREAARHHMQEGDLQAALSHFDQAGDLEEVISILLDSGEHLLHSGRLELMRRWIDRLPSSYLEQHPRLLFWRGEVERAASRFHEAEHWYRLAEGGYITKRDVVGRSRVYRGQAQVYLDTIQPNKASYWLQKAVTILGDDHPEEQAKILRLLAENHTNSGDLQEANLLIERADLLVPAVRDELDIRLYLRTGRLRDARGMAQEIVDRQQHLGIALHERVAKSHREMHLLLALIDAFLGDAASSQWHAEQGIRMGQTLRSPFVEMVGYMRLGHALGIQGRLEEAQDCYRKAVELTEGLAVERGKVEALMGLCITTGLLGELEQAERHARAGLEIALNVHDRWCANMVRLAIGSVWGSWGHYEQALPWLLDAEAGFQACGDHFLLTNVQLWLSIAYHRTGQEEAFSAVTPQLLENVAAGGYEDLFVKRTLFGPSDLQMCVPTLIEARDALGLKAADPILRRMGFRSLERHPGYTLRIYTLGKFAVCRGLEEVGRKEWKREKSRQLFQLLVTRHGQYFQREEIYDLLWPDDDEKTANRDFKVAMNALANALEPKREARANSFFIDRLDTAYRLQTEAAVWIDVQEFEALAEAGLSGSGAEAVRSLRAALRLYQGDFFDDYPYLDWCAHERERIRTLYLRVLERLAVWHREREEHDEVILCCEKILAVDPAWELAYRLLMQSYHLLGHRNLVIATYKKCVTALDDHLGLAPMEETTRLYQRFVRGAQGA